ALLRELVEARPPHGDERVLGRDEEAVQEDEDGDGEKLESLLHARERPVLGGKSSSSTRLGGSIGKRSAVIGARGAVGEHEPLAVRQRLGDGEAPLAVAEVVSEEGEREVVAGPRGAAELRLQAVEPVAVVLD